MGRSKADTQKHKERLLEALEKSLGIVTTACKIVNLNRLTYYRWLQTDPEFKKSVDEIKNVTLDFVESKLLENIKNGSSAEVIFYLKTKGKNRGYVERTENVNVEKKSFSDLSDAELKKKVVKLKRNVK